MIRKETWLPLAALALSAAFLIVSWLVHLTRGNPWLIKRKLKLGALLLGVNGAAAGCGPDGYVTCYAPAPQNWIHFDAPFATPTGLVVDLSQGSALTGTIDQPNRSTYGYQLLFEDEEVQRGELVAIDGAFNEESEAFRLTLDPSRLPPKGILRLHRSASADIGPYTLIDQYPLTVLNRP